MVLNFVAASHSLARSFQTRAPLIVSFGFMTVMVFHYLYWFLTCFYVVNWHQSVMITWCCYCYCSFFDLKSTLTKVRGNTYILISFHFRYPISATLSIQYYSYQGQLALYMYIPTCNFPEWVLVPNLLYSGKFLFRK